MKIQPISKDTVEQPMLDPAGESVYELIGNSTRIQPVAHPNRVDEHTLGANHSLAQISIAPGAASKPHYHKICQESYYILSGLAKMYIDEQELDLSPGQACLILPGQVHQICNHGDQILEFLAVCVPAWFASDSVYVQGK
ncbi:MAG TPA: cupin domain-containing protein [Anaerolineales bacterium]|nr:cupin domain-containing protein [Anaerolineales bacterium]